jgi:glycyl-tRNA synthetase beta chain
VKQTLLIEIGTEELPPKALSKLSAVFREGIEKGLRAESFSFDSATAYATPRRLAVSIAGLDGTQPDRVEQRRGPAVAAAFDAAGEPTKAALGFARSCGVEIEALGRLETEQGAWLSFEREVTGQAIETVVAALISAALNALPIPKRMRWGAGEVEFVRPVKWVTVLFGDALVACDVMGLASGRTTRGHRFHAPGTIELSHAESYSEQLEADGYVVASFEKRRQLILDLIKAERETLGGEAVIDKDLLDEVTALVEWPVVICGQFEAHFLELPPEVLIASMQDHQKYFPVRKPDGQLTNRFITIANLQSKDLSVVQDGNERVIRPRLSDASFFYRTDRGQALETRLEGLADMVFEKRLGSLQDKTLRVQKVATEIAALGHCETDSAVRAALLSRCDLLSEMVGEFPELQGTMGGYYAAADGETNVVAEAIGEFYFPRFSGDRIPRTEVGRCIAIADRLDSLVGIFGIGSAPTGDKDPFALRRAALGTVRVLIEGEIDLNLIDAIGLACNAYGDIELADDTATAVYDFARERMRGYYLDQGVPSDVCTAVFANNPGSPLEVSRRIAALVEFRALDAAVALSAANKRISNILKKLDADVPGQWRRERLSEAAEIELATQLDAIRDGAEVDFRAHDYSAFMQRLASLDGAVDSFFDEVMVMSDDLDLRNNRLALLADLHELFTRVADISHLHA